MGVPPLAWTEFELVPEYFQLAVIHHDPSRCAGGHARYSGGKVNAVVMG